MAHGPPRQRSTAVPLALSFVALLLYASLYPFDGWRWPPGLSGWQLLRPPWPPWRDRFDEGANLLGYLPLGLLLYAAVLRSGGRAGAALAAAVLAAASLSYAIEVTQSFLPQRVPSLKDFALNTAGATLGALLGALLHRLGWFDRWQVLRDRWFVRHSAAALVLLLLWPVALLFPAPVPLGLGQVWQPLRGLAQAVLDGTPWADAAAPWLLAEPAASRAALSRALETLTIALGLLGPCLVAFSTARAGWHRLALVAGALSIAVAVSTLSTALSVGPEHALAWWSAITLPSLLAGASAALLCLALGRRLAAALGLVALTALVVLVAQAPTDPYYAASLQGWERGRFIRFHGLAQWVGWLWPYAAIAWLLTRLGGREGD